VTLMILKYQRQIISILN